MIALRSWRIGPKLAATLRDLSHPSSLTGITATLQSGGTIEPAQLNSGIGERLFLALDTVKGHNRKVFDKLQVRSRTEAVARARDLGL